MLGIGLPRRAALVCALVLLSSAGKARAFSLDGLDGVWERDDKKTYRILNSNGVEESPRGTFACRFHWEQSFTDEVVRFDLRFTSRSDERGWFTTEAKTVGPVKEAKPEKLEMVFGWVDLDAQGKPTARGEERHTLKRVRKLTDHEQWALIAILDAHARVDAHLSPEFDPEAALAMVTKAMENEDCAKDPYLIERKKTLEKARRTVTAPKRSEPVKCELLGLVAREESSKDYGPRATRIRFTNASDKRVDTVAVRLHYRDSSGKELDDAQDETWIAFSGLEAKASEEAKLGRNIPDATTTVKLELREVSFADGTTWCPYHPPVSSAGYSGKPVEVISVGLVTVSKDEIDAFHCPDRVPEVGIHNASPIAITLIEVTLHFKAADGTELGKPENLVIPRFLPLEPDEYYHHARLFKAVPEGTVSIVGEVEEVCFADKGIWKRETGSVSAP